eukprot:CAMPEP_0206566342 /NCGR_PEP_ID=MMETSP0325_2-20121206/24607_1 /ASSEMBLY_ACC=CAM_ASM_000347 /TAXON_ID=2866 /ORGANISM="Crypthecodinium cohnii, Strain Seligo" /LENGTH=597 /DNA_ID=CAMNT_0054069365 /DNA_START=147 /DNA_END=1940 /DNA_ORIENTATION=-
MPADADAYFFKSFGHKHSDLGLAPTLLRTSSHSLGEDGPSGKVQQASTKMSNAEATSGAASGTGPRRLQHHRSEPALALGRKDSVNFEQQSNYMGSTCSGSGSSAPTPPVLDLSWSIFSELAVKHHSSLASEAFNPPSRSLGHHASSTRDLAARLEGSYLSSRSFSAPKLGQDAPGPQPHTRAKPLDEVVRSSSSGSSASSSVLASRLGDQHRQQRQLQHQQQQRQQQQQSLCRKQTSLSTKYPQPPFEQMIPLQQVHSRAEDLLHLQQQQQHQIRPEDELQQQQRLQRQRERPQHVLPSQQQQQQHQQHEAITYFSSHRHTSPPPSLCLSSPASAIQTPPNREGIRETKECYNPRKDGQDVDLSVLGSQQTQVAKRQQSSNLEVRSGRVSTSDRHFDPLLEERHLLLEASRVAFGAWRTECWRATRARLVASEVERSTLTKHLVEVERACEELATRNIALESELERVDALQQQQFEEREALELRLDTAERVAERAARLSAEAAKVQAEALEELQKLEFYEEDQQHQQQQQMTAVTWEGQARVVVEDHHHHHHLFLEASSQQQQQQQQLDPDPDPTNRDEPERTAAALSSLTSANHN